MTDEAAGVPTTRNDEDRQDNDRQDEPRPAPEAQDAPGAQDAQETQDAPGAPGGSGASDAAAGEPVGPEDAAPRPEARLARAVQVAEQALIEFEIAVETFRVEVENFSRLHHQKLGPMYTRLDELDALIAEAKAARTGDPEDERKAREARAVVMPMPGVDELFHDWMDTDGLSPEAAAMLTEQPVRPPKRVRPSEEARKLYRELARKAHPDLAQDEPERQRRDEFIARVNAAYGRGDVELLKELVAEWAAGPVQPLTPLSESEELYARLEWLSRRKELLTVLAKELEEGAIGSMLRMAPDDPDQLLEDIAEQLLGEVSRREAELAEMVQ
ncbi:J domain-containing protein [Streptomyces sp. SID14515]|uniref:J domain-containing protein n=1 Tax=Streptomyces sp. SID14515 TaxID=2706074 RepID=UPI0013CB7F6B|nr:J domain-containing protein [Streptomyces sp. SID14515]